MTFVRMEETLDWIVNLKSWKGATNCSLLVNEDRTWKQQEQEFHLRQQSNFLEKQLCLWGHFFQNNTHLTSAFEKNLHFFRFRFGIFLIGGQQQKKSEGTASLKNNKAPKSHKHFSMSNKLTHKLWKYLDQPNTEKRLWALNFEICLEVQPVAALEKNTSAKMTYHGASHTIDGSEIR